MPIGPDAPLMAGNFRDTGLRVKRKKNEMYFVDGKGRVMATCRRGHCRTRKSKGACSRRSKRSKRC